MLLRNVFGRISLTIVRALVISLFAAESVAFGQIGTTASFVGAVRDSSRAVLPGATVTATHVATGTVQSVTTDDAGRYLIALLPLGRYRIEASLQGFQSEVHTDIVLTVGKTQEVNFTLSVGDIAESVTVTGGPPLIETSSSSVTTLVTGDTLRTLPLNGRSFDQLIILSPGTVMFDQRAPNAFKGLSNQFSAGGTRPGATRLMVDGSEYAGAGGNHTNVNTASGKLLGVEAIQEFAVVTNSADASFGKKGGGQVNIVTRSGANEFHGSAFEFVRNDVFDSRNFFDIEKPDLRRHNYGFAVGGRIVRNRSFFFGNFEQLTERRGITDLRLVPTVAVRQGIFPDGTVVPVNPAATPLLNVYPLPNGRDFGDGTAEFRVTNTRRIDDTFVTGRVDHTLSKGDSLFGRYLIQTGVLLDPAGGLGQFADRAPLRTQLGTIGYKKTLSSRLLNQATLGFNIGYFLMDIVPINGFQPPPEMFLVPGETNNGAISVAVSGGGGGTAANPFPSLGGGISIGAQDRFVDRRVFDFSDQISYMKGAHYLQGGVNIQRIHSNEFQQPQKRGNLRFPSLEALIQGRPNQLNGPFPESDAYRDWRQTYVGVYVQDDYRLKPTFTANLGLRWELLSNPTERQGRIGRWVPVDGVYPDAPTVAGVDHVFVKNNSGNFVPRVGFAWDVFGAGRTSIRSGMGLFYTQIESEYRRNLGMGAPFTRGANITNPPFPNPGQALGAANFSWRNVSPLGVEAAPKIPTTLQYNLSMEQQLGPHTVLAVGYVGSRGNNFARITQPQIPAPFLNAAGRLQVPTQVINPAVNTNATLVVWDASSSYDSLQVEVGRRLSRGLQFKASFTWAKAIDESSELAASLSGLAEVTLVATDPSFDRGLAPYDVRRRVVLTWSYELPVSNHGGPLGALINGWQWSGVFQAQDGFPFSVFDGFSRSFPASTRTGDRPDVVAGRTRDSIILGGPDRYFDPMAFVLQPPNVLGNTAPGFLIGPGLALVDVSVLKTFRLTQRKDLQFRMDVFNLLNRANFSLPDNTLFQANGQRRGAAGQIRSTSTTAREFQFGLKFMF